MARRTRKTDDQPSTTSNEAQEATMSTTTEAPIEADETTEETTEEAVAETPTEKPAEVEVDLSAFEAVVQTAVENKDDATGEIAPVFIDPVVKAYRDLDGLKAKNKAREFLNEAMKTWMNKMDIATARAYLTLTSSLSPGARPKAEKKVVDPTEAFVARYVGLRLALSLVGENIPEGVDEGWAEKAKAEFEAHVDAARQLVAFNADESEDKGEAPEVDAVVKAAVKLAAGKSARAGGASTKSSPYTGERRDIAKHIAEAFAGLESGDFLTVSEIRNHTSEEYGDSHPSAGAISARLFPTSGTCTVEGVIPDQNEKGNKGATKA